MSKRRLVLVLMLACRLLPIVTTAKPKLIERPWRIKGTHTVTFNWPEDPTLPAPLVPWTIVGDGEASHCGHFTMEGDGNLYFDGSDPGLPGIIPPYPYSYGQGPTTAAGGSGWTWVGWEMLGEGVPVFIELTEGHGRFEGGSGGAVLELVEVEETYDIYGRPVTRTYSYKGEGTITY